MNRRLIFPVVFLSVWLAGCGADVRLGDREDHTHDLRSSDNEMSMVTLLVITPKDPAPAGASHTRR